MGIERYRNVIIGSGEGGKYLAWHLAGSGEQTMVIERRWIGGSPVVLLLHGFHTSSFQYRELIGKLTEALGLERYALYVFDYGAPTGFRLAMVHPERVTAIVSQNGNAYDESIRKVLNAEGMRREYASGIAQPDRVAPEGYTLDAVLMARPGNQDIQLDLFLDYANNEENR